MLCTAGEQACMQGGVVMHSMHDASHHAVVHPHVATELEGVAVLLRDRHARHRCPHLPAACMRFSISKVLQHA